MIANLCRRRRSRGDRRRRSGRRRCETCSGKTLPGRNRRHCGAPPIRARKIPRQVSRSAIPPDLETFNLPPAFPNASASIRHSHQLRRRNLFLGPGNFFVRTCRLVRLNEVRQKSGLVHIAQLTIQTTPKSNEPLRTSLCSCLPCCLFFIHPPAPRSVAGRYR